MDLGGESPGTVMGGRLSLQTLNDGLNLFNGRHQTNRGVHELSAKLRKLGGSVIDVSA
jgi:hypothetical protein